MLSKFMFLRQFSTLLIKTNKDLCHIRLIIYCRSEIPKLCAAAPWCVVRGAAAAEMRVTVSSLIPRFKKLCSGVQAHPSH